MIVASIYGGMEMKQSDLDYYRQRIAAEEIAAQHATHPLAAASHRRLAEEYASLVAAGDEAKLLTHV
jgi:hypothetical protein